MMSFNSKTAHTNVANDARMAAGGNDRIGNDFYNLRNQLIQLHIDMNLCVNVQDSEILPALSKLSSVSHENIMKFVGLVLDGPVRCVLTDVTTRGSLYDLLGGGDLELTLDFKVALMLDVVNGMDYLHRSALGYHGQLTSKYCFLDSKFTCKIGSYWLKALLAPSAHNLYITEDSDDVLWMAPEVLRSQEGINSKCDVYSFGIMVQEILLLSKPYAANDPCLLPSEIINLVANKERQCRPVIPGFDSEWIRLAENCWNENPTLRPTFVEIKQRLVKLNGGKSVNAIESVINRMEAHTRHLEEIVEHRSLELVTEKARAENLLCELLPKSVFEQLKLGKQVQPETFEEVTMFFSDIEGFTKIASLATPMGIVSLLNRLYMLFDSAIDKYDAYKVATIGDAYIVVSGLPEKNGDRHAGEIALLSLELIDSIKGFEIPHIPGTFLNMRVGLHTGACVAAITGLKMPRYLLFGDTVNIGARIEALGEAMKVHVSDTTIKLLVGDRRFIVQLREDKMEIPGHGTMQTAWLIRNIGDWFMNGWDTS